MIVRLTFRSLFLAGRASDEDVSGRSQDPKVGLVEVHGFVQEPRLSVAQNPEVAFLVYLELSEWYA